MDGIDWTAIAREFGVPMGILAAFSGGVWIAGSRILSWCGTNLFTNFLVPLRERGIAFLDAHTQWMVRMEVDHQDFRKTYERHDEWERAQALERLTKIADVQAVSKDLTNKVTDLQMVVTELSERIVKVENEKPK